VEKLRFRDLVEGELCCHAHTRRMEGADRCAEHTHDFHELFWVEQGDAWHLVNGERRRVRSGHLVLVAASDTHGFELVDASQPFRLVNVAFPRAVWTSVIQRYAEEDLTERKPEAREFSMGTAERSELEMAAHEVRNGAASRRALERLLLNVLYLCERLSKAALSPRVPLWLSKALDAVQDPKYFPNGTSALVELCGHSPEHVAREVRRWLGKTPTDVMNEARLAYASATLGETSRPVLEIALECGYENISHFYRLFRARYGTSPGQYRTRQQRFLESA
jgi:AraC-like DNA-binding protein